jgi:hypothetical protein
MNARRRLPIGAQDAILRHISNFDFFTASHASDRMWIRPLAMEG